MFKLNDRCQYLYLRMTIKNTTGYHVTCGFTGSGRCSAPVGGLGLFADRNVKKAFWGFVFSLDHWETTENYISNLVCSL